ncbi:MAG: hypothetical protein HW415_378 [Deltaproteobacteria bacterium]|nr:hypothetical protein [Deltaproteobacteria bacterium]
MTIQHPHIIIIAGPNGAGKSTTAPSLLQGTLGVKEFVNADVIAQGLSAFQPETAAFHAGRIMLERLHYLAKEGVDFAFETTLASRTFASWIDDLRKTGYICNLVFLWLPSPEFAVARVQERVRMGGHNVPEDVVRRRYKAGIRNFFQLYQPLTESWRFYDNSDPSGPKVIAAGDGKDVHTINDTEKWNVIEGGAKE